MGEDTGGPGPPAHDGPAASGATEKPCITKGCNRSVQATGPGNHKYCNDCKKARSSPAPSALKEKTKRKNSELSPIEPVLAKLSKEDDFAFDFDSAFDCDFDTFITLDRCSQLAKFQNFFFNVAERDAASKCDITRLTDQINSLNAKLNTAKLAFADKQIQLFTATQSTTSVAAAARPINPKPAKEVVVRDKPTKSVSTVPASKPVDLRPTLVARLCKDVSKDKVSADKIDSLLGVQTDGPIVQQFKKMDDRVTLTFRDAAARDKAKDLISNSREQGVFQSVYILQKSYPAIARLNGLKKVQSITSDDPKQTKRSQCDLILQLVREENPLLSETLSSVRILSNRVDTCSFLVRLGLSSKSSCDLLLETGRVTVDGRKHAVAVPDPSKEIRHCSRCQKYGHLATFCKAAIETCGKCAGPHASSACAALPKSFKCANCSRNHIAGAKVCPAHSKAVSQFLSYIST